MCNEERENLKQIGNEPTRYCDKDELLEEGYEPIGGFTEWLVDGESMKIQILEKDDDIRYVDKTGSEIDFDGGIDVP